MLLLALLPGVFSKVYANGSLKEGLLVASALAALLLMVSGQRITLNRARQLSRRFCLAIVIITLHGLLMTLNDGFSISRFTLSLIFLFVIFFLWLPITEAFFDATAADLDGALRWCYWILLLDGFVSTVLYRLGATKVMFFAAEPSHFALTFLPLLFYVLFRDRSPWHFVGALAIAIFIGNLTLLVGVALLTVFYCRHRPLSLAVALALGVLLVVISPSFSEYVMGRLTFSSDSENLSTLVFLSGYERAYETLSSGHWLGVGFQQMGYVGPSGKLMDTITKIMGGTELNLFDGGTLASKLIVEFGVVGIAVLLFYLTGFIRLLLRGIPEASDPAAVFFLGIYISFACDLFVRGTGYMSIAVVLFFVAQIYLAKVGLLQHPIVAAFGRFLRFQPNRTDVTRKASKVDFNGLQCREGA